VDPRIAQILNEKFIPLKVDANKDPQLTEALRVQSYPTIIMASSDGKIIGTLEGYVEAARFHEHLQRILSGLNNPAWIARDYEEATKAIATADHAKAIALLKNIVEDGKDRPLQVKARQILQDLEQQASGLLARAKQMDEKGQTPQAIHTLSELLRSYAGTQAAIESGKLLDVLSSRPEFKVQIRNHRARELLAQAREDYRTQQYLCCLDRCDALSRNYADLPEGAEAVQLAAEIKNNTAWMQQACESLGERLGGLYLSMAETYIQKGQPQLAMNYLERVTVLLPGTIQAETAQVRLSAMQGQSAWRTGYKKP
jgi:tetratricopeptide (TPR) repeat protein